MPPKQDCPFPLDEIRRRYEAGESFRALCRSLGFGESAVRRWVRLSGARIRPGRPKPPPLDPTLLRAWSAEGLSCLDIAQRVGNCSDEYVRDTMVRLGIHRRPQHAGARPERNHFWAGGRTIDKHGYVLVKANDHPHATATGYVREHRLVMERVLGRYLDPKEVVDHIDGNTSNNDPANLRLFASNAEHLRATLKGKCPKWTEDGKRRIREGNQRKLERRAASHQASGSDAPPSP
jgi:hypothetical protein